MMVRILCYGDSNTYGYNPDMTGRFDETIRWPKVLQKRLGTNYEIIEEGLNGRTTVFEDPTSPRRNGLDYLPVSLLTHDPLDLIILMLGTNDTKPIFSANAFMISKGLEELVKTIKNPFNYNTGMVPKILIVAPAPLLDNMENADMRGIFGSAAAISRDLSSCYASIADLYACEFMYAGQFATVSKLDGVHLDAENHSLLAGALENKIREILPVS